MKKCKLLNRETGGLLAATPLGNEYFRNDAEEQNKAAEWVGYFLLVPLLSKLFFMKLYRQITALQPKDFFRICHYPKATFDYTVHSHSAYEINLVMNAAGNRLVGSELDKYEKIDLTLLGPNIIHCWDNVDAGKHDYPVASIIIIQFEENLFDYLFTKEAFLSIKTMLQYAKRGIEFTGVTRRKAMNQLKTMLKLEPFEASISFLKLLQLLAISDEKRLIVSSGYTTKIIPSESTRIDEVYTFIQNNFHKPIKAEEAAKLANMSPSTFSHYFKKSNNKSFTRFVAEVRISNVCQLLTTTQLDISEIAFQSGYSNMSNFNRLFKKYKGCTPIQFRNKIKDSMQFRWSENQKK